MAKELYIVTLGFNTEHCAILYANTPEEAEELASHTYVGLCLHGTEGVLPNTYHEASLWKPTGRRDGTPVGEMLLCRGRDEIEVFSTSVYPERASFARKLARHIKAKENED